ncbi:MAG: hypothetical protein WC959_12870 [Kiritimatiellales bacterium]
MRAWAINCGVPLVCAFPWESVIYDRDGSLCAQAGTLTTTVQFGYHSPWITCSLNFRRRIYHLDDNQLRLPELCKKYGGSMDIRLMERDGRMMLTAQSPEINLDAIESEFGLIPLQTYLRDSRAMVQRFTQIAEKFCTQSRKKRV